MSHRSKQFLIDDLSMKESWRLFKIMSEIVEGFENLSEIGPAVSMFGSARVKPEDPLYLQTVEISKKLSEAGYSVITGGGPGLMEAGNKGAFENGGESIGLHIHLPMEQHNNEYLNIRSDFRYFFIRKLMFIKYALAYVALPGGYGTLDELAEALVLIQTHRIKPFPIVMFGTEFWSGLVEWFEKQIVANNFAKKEDLNLFIITDDPDKVVAHIRKHVII
ncbi:TIGR00730 family Rossman fold protein [Pseudodesulfovibrio cashew]|uniref:Cytokinin riboside 5'-monophosphate phosphoribohydrolase n=1 Tax=Pseudodesulfovibrio cashew TaxID=2678688 RepID=A0A6I6JLJ0_9BACT|nr:TIGR00730 family Rossman fold protein [Pseudodesulfovibrio cashew]QGY42069.1 TIGR00730 family Rossman fold protein [Pseudodesulfovibrio cashew]